MSAPAMVKRPSILVLSLIVLAGAVGALGYSLLALSARQAALPAVVAIDKQALADALADSPWVSSRDSTGDSPEADDGPVLWLLTGPDCGACRAFERKALPRLLESGVEVRAIAVAPRALPLRAPAALQLADLTRQRDWTALHLWMQGQRSPPDALDPAEEDGLLEWGRQSAERIADVLKRNDLAYRTPLMFWRDGPEWRVSFGVGPGTFEEIERELAAPRA